MNKDVYIVSSPAPLYPPPSVRIVPSLSEQAGWKSLGVHDSTSGHIEPVHVRAVGRPQHASVVTRLELRLLHWPTWRV